jgi:hypothetical protein
MDEKRQTNVVLAINHDADGFSDPNLGGSRSIIHGSKLKFTNDYRWIAGADGIEVDPAAEFLVVKIGRFVQRWGEPNQPPLETIELKPNEKPCIDERNDAVPRSEWRVKFGKSVGPYEFTYAAFLFDPVTMATYTYLTNNAVGGNIAIEQLKDATCRARLIHGEDYYPDVTLGHTHMPTAFGGRERPAFIVKNFVRIKPGGSQGAPAIAEPAAPTIDAKKPVPERGASDAEMNDTIKY